MADVRCPMCSKPNPEEAEECEFCGARLSPLVVDPSAGTAPEEQGPQEGDRAGEGEEETPDWLSRIRRREDEESEPVEEEEESEGPDWLSRLRTTSEEEKGPPPGEVPDWVAGAEGDEPDEADDWLERLRETADAEAQGEVGDAAPGDQLEAVPDRGDEGPAEEPSEPTPPKPGESDEAVFGSAEEDAEGPGIPQWLDDEIPDEAGEEVGPPAPGPTAAESSSSEPGEAPGRPDWFEEFERAGEEEPEPLAGEEAGPGLPEWLADEEPTAQEGMAPADEPTPEPPPDLEPASEELGWDSFDWDSLSEAPEELEETTPENLGAPPEEGREEELPHVPALITGEDDDLPPEGSDEFDLDAIQLPDWLSEVERPAQEGEEGAWEQDEGLAPATIPSWLESMRPVETFQPVVELEPEEEESVESVGPLAGLRGVLLAEPVVAKPRTSTKVGTQLQVTERQYAQASLLNRIVEEEEQELAVSRGKERRLPLARWLISLALVVAVLLPPLLGTPSFPTPTMVSRNLRPLQELVNTIPTDEPALVVFDYEPGYSAELEGVAGSLLENLMARDMRVVTVATRPTGPPLALDLVETIGAPHALENGRNYVHLGYLSGGPTAVQLFSSAPRDAILDGFMLPEEFEAQSAWDLPILRGVNSLSDFGVVAVIASGTDNARMWAEQASPLMGDTPLLMVLSTGAEPLIRPYFESLDPQVDGILTGLPAAVAYEEYNGRSGAARARWDAFGAGVLAVEGVLLVGTLYGVAQWILQRRQERE